MALSDVLNNLTGARDALVTAINGKGGTVAASATLRQCADAVTALPDGGGSSGNDPVFDGLIFYLSFDRWMIDSVNSTQVTWSGISPVEGKNGLCGQFDGISAKASIPRDVVSIKGKSAWSVAGWLKPEALKQTTMNPIYTEWNESDYGSSRFSVRLDSDLKIFSQVNFTDYQEEIDLFRVSTENPVAAGEWIHFVAVVDLSAKVIRLYLNGVEVASATNADAPESAPDLAPYNDPRLMYWGADIDYCVPGCLDEFAIWHRAISADEVAALYNSGAGLFYKKIESGNSIYTGDLVATVYGTPVGTITATLTCVNPDAIRQNDVVWEGNATAIIDYSFRVNTFSGKWSLNVDTNVMGDVAYGGDNFTTDNSVPWGATWTNTGGTSRTCEVSKA